MVIYKTTNLINGKIYVGKDCNNNPTYLGSGKIIKQAIKKYGRSNFKKETIEECDGSNWIEREQYWIAKLNARDHTIGYNIYEGGEGFKDGPSNPMFGKKQPLAVRLKMSKNHADYSGSNHPNFGKPMSEAQKLKLAIAKIGIKLSEEHKRKIGLAGIGRIGTMLGKNHSEETKKKISLAGKGRPAWNKGIPARNRGISPSDETRKKLSEAHKGAKNYWFGRRHTEATKQKMRDARLLKKKQYLERVAV